MADLFKGEICTTAYAKFRLLHPDWIFDSIVDHCKDGCFLLAVDVGCGSGQSCHRLCRHFRSVIGIDVSEDQIKAAKSKYEKEITFRVGQAEDLSFLDEHTLDLLTAGVSMHWFDIPKFLQEAKRVLKPGGVLAVYSYLMPRTDCPHVEAFYVELFKFMDSRTRHADEKYSNVDFPFLDVKRLEHVHAVDCTIDDFLGFLVSLSAWQKFTDQNQDAARKLEEKLREFYYDEKTGETRQMKMFYEYTLILCRK
ncbi:hypothetical protein CHS0354_007811 [Potamilus streckersoni]|uniref:Methyltransferase type 11 domain-containing protein n=1 Tax=Potamilus streckersoni TaxID=2493646 RepID=A0AAE0VHR8_9BIVA|nr:hypothetical protein CHS0354_007811 [Potamilus streckersoni]